VHHILFYEYAKDILERRAPHREAHLRRIHEHPSIVMAGALGDPPHGAAIVFREAAIEEIEAWADADPYVKAGLVRARRVDVFGVVRG